MTPTEAHQGYAVEIMDENQKTVKQLKLKKLYKVKYSGGFFLQYDVICRNPT
jgi:hypothetical protein